MAGLLLRKNNLEQLHSQGMMEDWSLADEPTAPREPRAPTAPATASTGHCRHRLHGTITEPWNAWLGRDLQAHLVPSPCHGHLPPDQAALPGLEPFQCTTTLGTGSHHPCSNKYLPNISSKPTPPAFLSFNCLSSYKKFAFLSIIRKTPRLEYFY